MTFPSKASFRVIDGWLDSSPYDPKVVDCGLFDVLFAEGDDSCMTDYFQEHTDMEGVTFIYCGEDPKRMRSYTCSFNLALRFISQWDSDDAKQRRTKFMQYAINHRHWHMRQVPLASLLLLCQPVCAISHYFVVYASQGFSARRVTTRRHTHPAPQPLPKPWRRRTSPC